MFNRVRVQLRSHLSYVNTLRCRIDKDFLSALSLIRNLLSKKYVRRGILGYPNPMKIYARKTSWSLLHAARTCYVYYETLIQTLNYTFIRSAIWIVTRKNNKRVSLRSSIPFRHMFYAIQYSISIDKENNLTNRDMFHRKMPAIKLFGRTWLAASDDLVYPGIFEIFIRSIW